MGWCNASFWGIFKHAAINCFWKNRVVLRWPNELNSSGSTVAAAWAWMTVEEAGARLAAAETLAVGWSEERQHFDVTWCKRFRCTNLLVTDD